MKTETKTVQGLLIDDVLRVYTGRPGCMCGCNGDYFYHPQTTETEAAVDIAKVTRVLRLMQAEEGSLELLNGGAILSLKTPLQQLAVYLRAGVVVVKRCRICDEPVGAAARETASDLCDICERRSADEAAVQS